MIVIWAPESTNALTFWPLTSQLMYSMKTWPKTSGANSIALDSCRFTFSVLISSSRRRWVSMSNSSSIVVATGAPAICCCRRPITC